MDLEMHSLQAQGGKTAAAGGQPLGTRGLRRTALMALTLFELTPLGGDRVPHRVPTIPTSPWGGGSRITKN